MSELMAVYHREKEVLAAVASRIDSVTICGECAGQCCLNGKFRINVLDALSLRMSGFSLSPDFDQKPLCPYGTVNGCLMEPGQRPAGCIQFICDAIDGQLSESEKSVLRSLEKALHDCLKDASQLLGIPVAAPLLLWAENNNNNF